MTEMNITQSMGGNIHELILKDKHVRRRDEWWMDGAIRSGALTLDEGKYATDEGILRVDEFHGLYVSNESY